MPSNQTLQLTEQEGTEIAHRSLFLFFGTAETFRKMEKISFGWKFHVAAAPESFGAILEVLKPLASTHDFLLKGLRDPFLLNRMASTIQQGKAFTIYFPQEEIAGAKAFAVEISEALAATLHPPLVRIHEKPFNSSQFLYYRFGEYLAGKSVVEIRRNSKAGFIYVCRDGHSWIRDRHGRKWLIGPGRELWMDRRMGSHKPPWIPDPFQA